MSPFLRWGCLEGVANAARRYSSAYVVGVLGAVMPSDLVMVDDGCCLEEIDDELTITLWLRPDLDDDTDMDELLAALASSSCTCSFVKRGRMGAEETLRSSAFVPPSRVLTRLGDTELLELVASVRLFVGLTSAELVSSSLPSATVLFKREAATGLRRGNFFLPEISLRWMLGRDRGEFMMRYYVVDNSFLFSIEWKGCLWEQQL